MIKPITLDTRIAWLPLEEAEDSLIADKSPEAIECVCFQCNPNLDPVRDQEALFYCPECDRSYEDGVFL